MIWWPVVLALLAAPFATYGYGWLDKQRTLAMHDQQLTAERREAEKLRQAAYQLGKRDGIADVRDQERVELEKTRTVIKEVMVEVQPPTPAEIIELCKRSASCRERRELK
jgi:hypothetical protein